MVYLEAHAPRVLQHGRPAHGNDQKLRLPRYAVARVELETTRVCHHYAQPCVSMKEALEPHVLNNEPGFSLQDLTGDECLHYINGVNCRATMADCN
jgi:hypothetical protein